MAQPSTIATAALSSVSVNLLISSSGLPDAIESFLLMNCSEKKVVSVRDPLMLSTSASKSFAAYVLTVLDF